MPPLFSRWRQRKKHQGVQTEVPAVYLNLWGRFSGKTDHSESTDWDSIRRTLEAKPSIAKYTSCDHRGMLLLHFCCGLKAPLSIIEQILQIYPDSVYHKSLSSEKIPLMLACGAGAPLQVIRRLLDYVTQKTHCT